MTSDTGHRSPVTHLLCFDLDGVLYSSEPFIADSYRESIARVLARHTPLAQSVTPLAGKADWASVHAALQRHFASRQPRFVLDPRGRASLAAFVRECCPDAPKAAAVRADAVAAGRFDLLGYLSLSFAKGSGLDIDWHLEANADAARPGISTDFLLTWKWGASTGDDPADTEGLKVVFKDVTLEAGKFFGEALQPYLKQIMDATKPLQPVIDTIFTPMPVISDLSVAAGGDEITIATLAEKFSTLAKGPRIKPFLDAIRTVKEFMEKVIQANQIQLPELAAGSKYVWDPEKGELMVERPQ